MFRRVAPLPAALVCIVVLGAGSALADEARPVLTDEETRGKYFLRTPVEEKRAQRPTTIKIRYPLPELVVIEQIPKSEEPDDFASIEEAVASR